MNCRLCFSKGFDKNSVLSTAVDIFGAHGEFVRCITAVDEAVWVFHQARFGIRWVTCHILLYKSSHASNKLELILMLQYGNILSHISVQPCRWTHTLQHFKMDPSLFYSWSNDTRHNHANNSSSYLGGKLSGLNNGRHSKHRADTDTVSCWLGRSSQISPVCPPCRGANLWLTLTSGLPVDRRRQEKTYILFKDWESVWKQGVMTHSPAPLSGLTGDTMRSSLL